MIQSPDTPPRSFTGRARRRTTSRMVRFADAFSLTLITMGGMATIFAVFVVCVFLVYVAAPLFSQAEADGPSALAQPGKGGNTGEAAEMPAFVTLNDYRLLICEVFADGRALVLDARDRRLLADHDLAQGRELTAWSFSSLDGHMALGFADGTVQLGRLRFSADFVPNEQAPAEALALEEGGVAALGDGVYEMTPSGVRVHRLDVEAEEPIPPETPSPVRLIDMTSYDQGAIYAALSEDGALRVRRARRQENWMTGETTYAVSGGALPYEAQEGDPPDFLRITALGDAVFTAWRDGRLKRFDTRDLRRPALAESFDAVPEEGESLTAMGFLIGRTTLVTGDSLGRVRAWFRVKPEVADRALDGKPLYLAEGLPNQGGVFSLRNRLARPDAGQMPPTLAGRSPDEYRVDASSDESPLALAHELARGPAAVTALAESARTRMLAAGYGDGSVRLFHVTTGRTVSDLPGRADGPVRSLALAPRDDGLLAATSKGLALWELRPRHPAATLRAIAAPVWYEGYSRPSLVWQSSGATDHFEPKYSLVPLVFGTAKATVYAMLFALPLAMLAAICTSEFLHASVKAWVKPLIEMMASLPSVVLGFLAALVFAPLIEDIVPATVSLFFTAPLAVLSGAFLWQLLPHETQLRLEHIGAPTAGRRRSGLLFRLAERALFLAGGVRMAGAWAMLAAAVGLAALAGPMAESWLFEGDLKAWLDGQVASAAGGWALLLLPFCGLAVAAAWVLRLGPALRPRVRHWPRSRVALLDLANFCAGAALAALLAGGLGRTLDLLGFDPRGSSIIPPHVFGTYGQRNAMVVGFAMAFAVIPIIYTIAEDALSAVPDHLRAASLGAGATRWQTALRIVIPTAMSGLFSATMIGLGRAVGETMIVLMAAGNTPVMEWNLFSGFRTLSANIAVELPEAAVGGTLYRMLFLAALTLFAMTFTVNTVAEIVRLRFRRRASHL